MNLLRSLFLGISRIPPALMLGIITGLAIVVSIMVTEQISSLKNAHDIEIGNLKAQNSAKTKVVYATKDIPEGMAISSDALEEREIDQNKTPQDAIPSTSLCVSRIAKYGIASGQILSQHDLAPQGISLGIQSKLKKGMRAITFGVDNNSGVAGFVTPEDRVDILAMVGSGADIKAQPILSDVEVIAVGQVYQKALGQTASSPANSVTVALTPDDANRLAKSFTVGKLYLTLRNFDDHTPVATVDITSLFGKPSPREVLIAQTPTLPILPPPTVSVISDTRDTSGTSPIALQPPQLRYHEIEIWSGSKKDILAVPKN
jgi:pilus assembly protein CpaB